ncbi:MAG: hypothetical protein ACTHJL_04930 [Amnibacterium sp.]
MPPADPWEIELTVVTGRSHPVAEQRALARDVERGLRRRLRRGAYVLEADLQALTGSGTAILRMRAFAATVAEQPLFSHWSAVVLHGLTSLRDGADLLDVTDGSRTRPLEGARLHRAPVTDEEIRSVNGLLCTAPLRTAVDVAGSAAFAEGVVVADSALGVTASDRPAFAAAVDLAGPRRAAAKIDAVVRFADGASGSAAESLSRVTMHRLGLPAPVLQHTFFDGDGFVARVDFWFPEACAVGEVDGRGKYVDPTMNKGDPALVVYREKLREDRIRALGPRVARWGWREAGSTALLGRRLASVGVLPLR